MRVVRCWLLAFNASEISSRFDQLVNGKPDDRSENQGQFNNPEKLRRHRLSPFEKTHDTNMGDLKKKAGGGGDSRQPGNASHMAKRPIRKPTG